MHSRKWVGQGLGGPPKDAAAFASPLSCHPALLTPACVLFLNTPSSFLPQGLCTTVILSRILLPDIHLVHIRSLLTSCQKGLL